MLDCAGANSGSAVVEGINVKSGFEELPIGFLLGIFLDEIDGMDGGKGAGVPDFNCEIFENGRAPGH